MTVMSSFRVDSEKRLILGAVGSLDRFGISVHRAWARRRLDALFPQLSVREFEYAWSGRIAMTSDHVPKIVEFGKRAFCIYGYSGRGIGPGTIFGMSVAEYLMSDKTDVLPLEPVGAHREWLAGIKAIGYELGATATHLAGSRVNR